MRIPHNFEKCIVCLDNPCGDWEHVLPAVIGGWLQGRMLCNSCNHNLGSTLVSALNSDITIHFAMEALKEQLPGLNAKIQKKTAFVGTAEDGSKIRASITNEGMKILPGRGENGSVILDTDDAVKALFKKLIRYGISQEDATLCKHRFLQLGENIPLTTPMGETFIKRKTPPLQPELGQFRIDDRLLALIAFEFLSLIIGNLILRQSFDPIRQYVKSGIATDRVTVDHFASGEKYDTFHVVSVAPVDTAIRVDIRLFRWITSVVTFYGFDYRGLDCVYIEDLQTHQSLFAPTRKDASQGNFIILKNP